MLNQSITSYFLKNSDSKTNIPMNSFFENTNLSYISNSNYTKVFRYKSNMELFE